MTEKHRLDVRMTSPKAFLEDILKLRFFSKGVVKATYEQGCGKLVLVTGENATGKSFLRRVIQSAFHERDLEVMALSMQFRAAPYNMARGFVYGDESTSATSSCTSNSILGAINTSRGRAAQHAIFWDEPDTGLSDNYAAGAADEILEFLVDPPESLLFAAVVTHRRVMLERLAAHGPHHVRLGDEKTLREVIKAPLEPRRLSDLRERNHKLFRAIGKEFGL